MAPARQSSIVSTSSGRPIQMMIIVAAVGTAVARITNQVTPGTRLTIR